MTKLLGTYEDFVNRVDELGFMAMSNLLPGIPSLGDETPKDLWHTGLETDPWRWKDRAAEEKRLAYGCILGGHKGFVSARMYPVFYAAFHPANLMAERWENGTINRTLWQVWQFFEEERTSNTSQVRKSLSSSSKESVRAIDTAIQQLQQEYFITVSGNDRKISAAGKPYGWPVNRFSLVADWSPPAWLENINQMSVEEARAAVLAHAVRFSHIVDHAKLKKKMGW